MPRPKRNRKMGLPPAMVGFKPFGIPFSKLESVELLFDEYESLRLADYLDLNQEEAAKKMGISRPTFTRIYDKARKTIAKAFAEGKVILIKGGSVEFEEEWFRCNTCDETFNAHNEEAESCDSCDSDDISKITETNHDHEIKHDSPKVCYCISCGTQVEHKMGQPCRNTHCPKCGGTMTGTNIS